MTTYRQATPGDADTVARLGLLLYGPDNSFGRLRAEAEKHLNSGTWALFLTFDGDTPVGLCEVSLRTDYVEGTSGGAVGYVEGIFVLPEYRGRHVAKTLVSLGEEWARKQGCREFASDCKLDNADSLSFHLKIGFEEAARSIHFVKKL
ncbi:MAG: GNAT family N-acetyltransferase [Oscillospiraceae bacterium]|nr:GNAT family N-acetyltransferase [Oscillospiraceae bacterium]